MPTFYNENVALYPAGTVFPSGATNGPLRTNAFYQGCRVYLKVTAVTGTNPTLNVKLQEYDSASGDYKDITGAAFPQQTGTGSLLTLTIHPQLTASAGVIVKDIMPAGWRTVATVGGTVSPTFTCSIGFSYMI